MNESCPISFKPPMDEFRLRFYYSLMAYCLGLITYITVNKPLHTICFGLFVIIVTPLTLLLKDSNNIYIEITITILFPTLSLLLGIIQGSLFVKIYNENFKLNDDDEIKEEEEEESKFKKLAYYCKMFTIGAIIIIILMFFFLDLTFGIVNLPAYVLTRFIIHLGLSIFLIALSIAFKQKKFCKLWIMVAFSTTTILITTFFLFNIITEHPYYVYFTFAIHFLFVIVIILIYIMCHKVFIECFNFCTSIPSPDNWGIADIWNDVYEIITKNGDDDDNTKNDKTL